MSLPHPHKVKIGFGESHMKPDTPQAATGTPSQEGGNVLTRERLQRMIGIHSGIIDGSFTEWVTHEEIIELMQLALASLDQHAAPHWATSLKMRSDLVTGAAPEPAKPGKLSGPAKSVAYRWGRGSGLSLTSARSRGKRRSRKKAVPFCVVRRINAESQYQNLRMSRRSPRLPKS